MSDNFFEKPMALPPAREGEAVRPGWESGLGALLTVATLLLLLCAPAVVILMWRWAL